jgi:tetratricopeptide (TPR) repeat protein
MAEDIILQEAINAIHDGDRTRARDLLARLLKNNPGNADYWIWMSSVVDSEKERIYCLREALQADPKNEAARRGLVLFGAMPVLDDTPGRPSIPHRSWPVRQVEAPKASGPRLPFSRARLISWGVAGVISIGLLIFGILTARNSIQYATNLRDEAPTAKASATYLPTNTPKFPTATPTYVGPRPLVLLLEATYTPTPIYGSTPRPVSEAYRSGLRLMGEADWKGALAFLDQVVQADPTSADAFYLEGEAYRQMGDYKKAIERYNQALKARDGYAPAYLGRARANQASNPKAKIEADMKRAVELDPKYGEGFLALTDFYIAKGDFENAAKSLQPALELMPESPLVYLDQAKVLFNTGDFAGAVEAAKKANGLDLTFLDAYRMLAVAQQANNQYPDSIAPLETYLPFHLEDVEAYVMAGNAYVLQGDVEKAIAAYSQAIQADPKGSTALVARGKLYLDQGQAEQSLADFNAALKNTPKDFDANLGLGRAMLAAGKAGDAYMQFEFCRNTADTDPQTATADYWDAQSLEVLGKTSAAVKVWQELLALPEGAASDEWRATAQEHINAILTPSPTPEPAVGTPSPVGTATQ